MARPTRAGAFRIRLVAVTTLLYVLFVLAVTLYPSTVDRNIDDYLARVLRELHERGVPVFVNYAFVEFAANVLFFVPVGFLGGLLFPFRATWLGALVGLALSLGVEAAQYLFLPGRVPTGRDVLANTLGALTGCLVAYLVRAVIRHRDVLVVRDAEDRRRARGEVALRV